MSVDLTGMKFSNNSKNIIYDFVKNNISKKLSLQECDYHLTIITNSINKIAVLLKNPTQKQSNGCFMAKVCISTGPKGIELIKKILIDEYQITIHHKEIFDFIGKDCLYPKDFNSFCFKYELTFDATAELKKNWESALKTDHTDITIELKKNWESALKADRTDITFHVNGKKLHAHLSILKSKLSYFQSIQNGKQSFTVNQFSFEVVQDFLEFTYTGTLNALKCKDFKLLSELFKLGKQFGSASMIAFCFDQFMHWLDNDFTTDHFNMLISLGFEYKMNDLIHACFKYAEANAEGLESLLAFANNRDKISSAMLFAAQHTSYKNTLAELVNKTNG